MDGFESTAPATRDGIDPACIHTPPPGNYTASPYVRSGAISRMAKRQFLCIDASGGAADVKLWAPIKATLGFELFVQKIDDTPNRISIVPGAGGYLEAIESSIVDQYDILHVIQKTATKFAVIP